jgi:histidinol-phosphate aminotransferase
MKTIPRFDNFPPYTPIEPFEVLSQRLGIPIDKIVKLDANENPYGPSPRALRALSELPFPHIYPDPESRALRAALAHYTGAPIENLLAGAGADELIDLLARALLEPGDVVLNFPPTFGMYSFDARLNGGEVVEIPRLPDGTLDLPAIQAAVQQRQPKLAFVTSPNNPDGRLMTDEEFEALIDLPLVLVLDEAYIEFADEGNGLGQRISRIQQVEERENLIVLRTFSKWAGLAGLRVGYGAFPTWMMETLWKIKQPYNVNVAANAAALASLEDTPYLAGNVELLRRERARLFDLLQGVPFLKPRPSCSNFILCDVIGWHARDLKDTLARQGVLVRHYDNPLLKDCIRISVGRPHETDAALAALHTCAKVKE